MSTLALPQIELNSASAARLRRFVLELRALRALSETEQLYEVELLPGTNLGDLRANIQPKILPPFWLAVASLEELPRGATTRNYVVTLSRSYLRDIARPAADIHELLLRLGAASQAFTVEPTYHNVLLTFTVTSAGSLVAALLRAVQSAAPQSLTAAELEEILNEIPELPTSDPYVGRLHLAEVQRHIRSQFASVKVSPVQVPALKRELRRAYLRALMQPNEQVGIEAVISAMATLMQNALSSRHKFGTSAGMSATIELFIEVLLNHHVKEPEMTVVFRNRRISEIEIVQLRALFEQITFNDILMEHETETVQIYYEDWWIAYIQLRGDSPPPQLLNRGPNGEMAGVLLRLQINPVTLYEHNLSMTDLVHVVRRHSELLYTIPSPITIDPTTGDPVAYLYLLPIHPEKIREKVRERGIEISYEMLEIAFLSIVVMPDLKNLRISGITDIYEITPNYFEVVSEVPERNSFTMSNPEPALGPEVWRLSVERLRMKRNGVLPRDIDYLLQQPAFGITNVVWLRPDGTPITDERERQSIDIEHLRCTYQPVSLEQYLSYWGIYPDQITGNSIRGTNILLADLLPIGLAPEQTTNNVFIVPAQAGRDERLATLRNFTFLESERIEAPQLRQSEIALELQVVQANTFRVTWPLKPHLYLAQLLRAEMAEWKKEEQRFREIEPYYIHPLKALNTANRIYVVQTAGSNLRAVCLLDIVDPSQTYSNVPSEMLEVFGIEVAMAMVLRILLLVLTNAGAYADLGYLMLITEMKCNTGVVLGVDYTGLSRQPVETLSKGTAQRAVSGAVRSAATGRLEEVQNVSTVQLVGKLGQFGANSVGVVEGEIPGMPSGVRSVLPAPLTAFEQTTNTNADEVRAAQSAAGILPNANGFSPHLPPLTAPTAPLGSSLTPVITPTLTQPSARLDPAFPIQPEYTLRAANDLQIPIRPAQDPVITLTSYATVPLPNFHHLGLALPPVLMALFGLNNAPSAIRGLARVFGKT